MIPCHPRNKSGILGWRSEKTEMVNGYEAKVRGREMSCPGAVAGCSQVLTSFPSLTRSTVLPTWS